MSVLKTHHYLSMGFRIKLSERLSVSFAVGSSENGTMCFLATVAMTTLMGVV